MEEKVGFLVLFIFRIGKFREELVEKKGVVLDFFFGWYMIVDVFSFLEKLFLFEFDLERLFVVLFGKGL